jgi:hypothetical protein
MTETLKTFKAYRTVVEKTAGMVNDRTAQKLAKKHKLEVLDVTWEDTGRYKGSTVGPNISDMTIQVQMKNPKSGEVELKAMPVIRTPNFTDETGDVPIDKFKLLVGNERGGGLHAVTIRDLLSNIRSYLSDPLSWGGRRQSLLAKRDTHVLVSAQACFLPIPKQGIAEFNPVIFNYQSYEGDPAVLTILATREGTSVTVIDNKRDPFEAGSTWGQRLFFNQKGERASLTGQRISEFEGDAGGPAPEAAGESALNMVLLIQVPLKQKNPMGGGFGMGDAGFMLCSPAYADLGEASDVEEAVIGHGEVEGPFTEIDGLEIERDEKFPVRATVQFYQATSNGVVSADDMERFAAQIKRVVSEADYVGSLVTRFDTGRPTEYEGDKFEPPGWWDEFWKRHEENTGMDRKETFEMLRKLLGRDWVPGDEEELLDAIRRFKAN